MSTRFFRRSARLNRSAALSIAIAVLSSCAREKSPASDDTSGGSAPAVGAADNSSLHVIPESSPEAMRAFAAAHLRPGLKPGDFLTNKADYPTGDTADVYRAVLDTLYVSKDGFPGQDRKSTRLNSSHSSISYAVFCLKKKKKKE